MPKISLSDVIGIAGIVLAILLLVLDKAGKLKGGWLYGLLGIACVMTLFIAIGNSWVLDEKRWLIWRGAFMCCAVLLTYSGIAIWISPTAQPPTEASLNLGHNAPVASPKPDNPSPEQLREEEVREQLGKLDPAELEAVRIVMIAGPTMPNQIESRVRQKGFSVPASGVVNGVRSKTALFQGSFSGEMSFNPDLKSAVEKLLPSFMAANPVPPPPSSLNRNPNVGKKPTPSSPPQPQQREAVIATLVAEARVTCLLRDPTKTPEDETFVTSEQYGTYLESPSAGKVYLIPISSAEYRRTDEEGYAYAIERWHLPDASELIGQPISRLNDFNHATFDAKGVDGGKFLSCKHLEVVLRANGTDIFKKSADFVADLPPSKALTFNFPISIGQ